MSKNSTTYHHGDLRNALLLAAEVLLEQNDVSSVSLREVAKVVGVSHTAPYRHFADKTALLVALDTIGYQRLYNAMEDCIDKHPNDPLKQLFSANQAYVELACKHPQMTNLMFGGIVKANEYTEELSVESKRAFNGLMTIIQNGQAAGVFVENDTKELALFVWSTVHGFSMLCSSGHLKEAATNKKQIQNLIDMLGQSLLTGIIKS